MKLKQMFCLWVIIFLLATGYKDPIAKSVFCDKPRIGFTSYDSYIVYLNQDTVKQPRDIRSEKYKPYGYDYFTMDAGWYYEFDVDPSTKLPLYMLHSVPVVSDLDENGFSEPSKGYFPASIKEFTDYTHRKGLKFGEHLMKIVSVPKGFNPKTSYIVNVKIKLI